MTLKIVYFVLWASLVAMLTFTHTGPWWQFAIIAVLVECLVMVKERLVLSQFKEKLFSMRDWSMALVESQEKRIAELENELRRD